MGQHSRNTFQGQKHDKKALPEYYRPYLIELFPNKNMETHADMSTISSWTVVTEEIFIEVYIFWDTFWTDTFVGKVTY